MKKFALSDLYCIAFILVAVLLVIGFSVGDAAHFPASDPDSGYENLLFDDRTVHKIDIVIEHWEDFIRNAPTERYAACDLIIDGETYTDVGIRAKGNNSRRLTEKYGHVRYSLKVEFDHYTAQTYHGLDKFALDASFQDNSYLKSCLTYDMMAFMEVPTPLTSWVWVTVNGEDWGLFLATEEPEEAFARRIWGENHGQLYKPDYKLLSDENADVHLRYIDDRIESYDNIFRTARFAPTDADKARVIEAIRILSTGENLEAAIDVEEVLRYFTVQVFVVNLDSYLGKNGHNYFLYEENGILSILPWDYNLAFGTYSLGMPDPINDATLYINYPINTPAAGEVMKKRPLYHNVMKNRTYYDRYHALFDQFIAGYFESGYFDAFVDETLALIAPYVEKDPTAFCSYDDFLLGSETIRRFCQLRAQSVRGQLSGTIPSTIRQQMEQGSDSFIDGSSVWLPDMGEIADLRNP